MLNYIKQLKAENGVRYFFFKTGMLLLMLVVIDFCIGKSLRYLYLQQRSGWEYWTKYSIKDTEANLVIMGSSRAQQQYNPVIFEERLNQTCYNAGRDGQSILYQYPVLQAILKRHQPKAILLEVEHNMFGYNNESYDRLSCLLPFYDSNPEMDSLLLLRGDHERIKLLSKMYPYNSLSFKILSGIIKGSDEVIKGYLPLRKTLQHEKHPVWLKNDYIIDKTRVQFFNALIQQCREQHVQLYFCCSPYYSNFLGQDTSLEMVRSIAAKNGIPFFDMSKGLPALNNPALFDDTAHVNINGFKDSL